MNDTPYAWLAAIDPRLQLLADEWTGTVAKVVEKVRYVGRSRAPEGFQDTRCAWCFHPVPRGVYLHELIVDYAPPLKTGPASFWLCYDADVCAYRKAVRT